MKKWMINLSLCLFAIALINFYLSISGSSLFGFSGWGVKVLQPVGTVNVEYKGVTTTTFVTEGRTVLETLTTTGTTLATVFQYVTTSATVVASTSVYTSTVTTSYISTLTTFYTSTFTTTTATTTGQTTTWVTSTATVTSTTRSYITSIQTMIEPTIPFVQLPVYTYSYVPYVPPPLYNPYKPYQLWSLIFGSEGFQVKLEDFWLGYLAVSSILLFLGLVYRREEILH